MIIPKNEIYEYIGLISSILGVIGVLFWDISKKTKLLFLIFLLIITFYFGILIGNGSFQIGNEIDDTLLEKYEIDLTPIDEPKVFELNNWEVKFTPIKHADFYFETFTELDSLINFYEDAHGYTWGTAYEFAVSDIFQKYHNLVSKVEGGFKFRLDNDFIVTFDSKIVQDTLLYGGFINYVFVDFNPQHMFVILKENYYKNYVYLLFDLSTNSIIYTDGRPWFSKSRNYITMTTFYQYLDKGPNDKEDPFGKICLNKMFGKIPKLLWEYNPYTDQKLQNGLTFHFSDVIWLNDKAFIVEVFFDDQILNTIPYLVEWSN